MSLTQSQKNRTLAGRAQALRACMDRLRTQLVQGLLLLPRFHSSVISPGDPVSRFIHFFQHLAEQPRQIEDQLTTSQRENLNQLHGQLTSGSDAPEEGSGLYFLAKVAKGLLNRFLRASEVAWVVHRICMLQSMLSEGLLDPNEFDGAVKSFQGKTALDAIEAPPWQRADDATERLGWENFLHNCAICREPVSLSQCTRNVLGPMHRACYECTSTWACLATLVTRCSQNMSELCLYMPNLSHNRHTTPAG